MAYCKLNKTRQAKSRACAGKQINENKKKYKYLYKKATEMETIKAAYKKMRRGKTNRRGIRRIDADFARYCQKMQRMLENTKPAGVPVEHPELAFNPKDHPAIAIQEKKPRQVKRPSITEQWVHHIIIWVLHPIFMNRLYNYSLGSIPKRTYGGRKERNGGAHKGKKKLETWIHGGFKFFIKADIRHFYDSIRVDKLLSGLAEYICDDWMMHLISLCFKYSKKGIALGFYIDQWTANMFLEPLDNMILRRGFRYMRYMDDIVILGDNKRELHALINDIKMVLGRLRLKLKCNWQVCRFDYIKKDGSRIGRPIDYMGFKFYRDKTVLRKHILKGMAQTARRIYQKKSIGQKICARQASSIVSRVGWIRHTDCYGWYLRNVKPFIEIRQMKRIISKAAKREQEAAGRKEALAT